jgi:translocation and assembly module TamB
MAISGHAAHEPEAPLPSPPSRSPGGAARGPGPTRRERPRRARRWLLVAAGSAGLVVLLACSSLWWLGSHLDHPWVKPRLLALVQGRLGLGIDYEGLELSLRRGIRARSLSLLTPPALAAGAPELARVDGLTLDAPLWAFAFGARSIDALRVAGLRVVVVRDESGRTSLDELFPEQPEPGAADEPARLSQLLDELPSLSIERIEVSPIAAELVELHDDGSRRVSSLSGLGLHGSLRSGDEGLAGTALEVSAAPLVLAVSSGSTRQQATLQARVGLRAAEAQALSLSVVASDLEARVDARAVSWPGSLVELNAALRTDPDAGRATLAVERASAFGGRLSLDARSELSDASGLRVATSGSARVELATLPIPIPGVAIDALRLDLATQELAWDGARVAGAVDVAGVLRGARLDEGGESAHVADLTLAGQGSFLPEGGRFQATVKAASLAARSLASNVEVSDIVLEVNGSTRELAGEQQLDARAVLALDAARATAAARRIELGGVRVEASLAGTTRDVSARIVPRLDASASVRQLAASAGPQRVSSTGLALNASGIELARDERAPFGVRGDALFTLAIPTLELVGGAGLGARGRRALSLSGVTLTGELPLSLAKAAGKVSIAALDGGGGLRVTGLALDVDADAPLAWGDGGARGHAHGRVAQLALGDGHRGSALELDLRVAEPERERYRLELELGSASLALGGAKLAGPIAATLRADAAAAGLVKLTSELRGTGGAAIDLGLDAQFERASERLSYSATLSGEKLAAFAVLATSAAPAAGRARLDRARLVASARGELSGVLRAGEGSLPVLAERPLASARGSQSARLELEGLDYRADAGALQIPSLALELESTHRGEAGGAASARLRLQELRFEGGGRSLRLDGVDQAIVASFERAPDQGMVDVDSALSVASAAQSWLPGFPVRGLRMSGNLQIDRLRSIFLRELALDNPASGSALRAAGTLELLAQGSPGGDKTIVGREALSFEGRLSQQLEALEGLELASHARGSLELPFRLESGGMLGYRLIAALEAKQVSFTAKDAAFAVEQLNGVVPMVEEFALLESGPVISAGPRSSPLSDTRFFDVHAFLSGDDYVTARSIRIGGLAPLGPIAANVRIDRSDFIIDQLQAGYQGGQIVGQVRAAWRDGDPIIRLRLNATGVKSGKSRDVFDANTALTFVPAAMTLDGKMQIVRASREHVDDILDVLDPFHESANANRVRSALALGYPKFVRFHLHDGAVDTKVELGGLAQLVRIDEIRAVPLGPILQKYVAPALPALPRSGVQAAPAPTSAEVPLASTLDAAHETPSRGVR